ncbi:MULTISPECIES: hypothetical protein [Kitasatospora]|uniref:PLL-like beta propeller domain-containing protein n=1 Tax=Kitasatospora cathayae TaxID=3004092 RepID=A0ABY7QEQ7_9ACTN|nr:hypothetical protein [Kitasatospora sp. HUAS 3-15]WBP91216.1 hypothetical protein O1G21_38625 [Kitasatospora sp. HUAS 3-15]
MPKNKKNTFRRVLAAAIATSGLVGALTTTTAAHAVGTSSPDGSITRSEILQRAQSWVDEQVPYSQSSAWSDSNGSYRSDCSGYISMAWHLSSALTTVTLPSVSTKLNSYDDLLPGDALDRYDNGNYNIHVVLFAGWTDSSHQTANIYTESTWGTVAHTTTMSRSAMDAGTYVPFRYNNVASDPAPAPTPITANNVHLYGLGSDNRVYDNYGNYGINKWNGFGLVDGTAGFKQITSTTTTDSTVHVYTIGSDNRIYENDGNYADGKWSGFGLVDGTAGFQQITAVATGTTVRLYALGSDNRVYENDGDYTKHSWSGFGLVDGTAGFKQITAAATTDASGNTTVHLYAIGSDNRVYDNDADLSAHKWGGFALVDGTAGYQQITAAALGTTVHLYALGSDNRIYENDGDYNAHTWTGFGLVDNTAGFKQITAVKTGASTVHLYAIGSDNRAYDNAGDYAAHKWAGFGLVDGTAGWQQLTAVASI